MLFFLLCVQLTSVTVATSTPYSTQTDIVYVTKTGSKYHRAGCRYLKKSYREITRTEAKEQGYTACSVCKP